MSQPIDWSMAAMLRDSVVVVVVVVVVVRTRPRAIPLAMITIRKSFMGFLFFPVMTMGLRLAALRAAGAPLLINSYFVINDFSDIVFFKKDSYPTWRLILEELLPPDTFTIYKDCIYHLELHIQIQYKNINIYPDKV